MAGDRTIFIRGEKYESMAHAARALGVSIQAVSKAKKLGTLDHVGLGRGNYPQRHQRFFGVPVLVDGVVYDSHKQAAKALGVSPHGVAALKKLKIAKAVRRSRQSKGS